MTLIGIIEWRTASTAKRIVRPKALTGPEHVRQPVHMPAGELHAWSTEEGQSACGAALADDGGPLTRLWADVPFDRALGWRCEECVTITRG